MSNGNHLLGAAPLYSSLGKAVSVYQSFSYEATDTTVADVYDSQLTVARTGAGVYTLTFPSDKLPSEVLDVRASSSVAGRSITWAYSAGVVTLTVNAVDAEGAWAAAATDEEIIRVTILCIN
jgi:hypothetical protein